MGITNIKDNVIITTMSDFYQLQKSKKIYVGIHEAVSTEFIQRLLSEDDYFECALKLFREEIDDLGFGIDLVGDLTQNVKYDRITIIKAVRYYVSSMKKILSDKELSRYEELLRELSLDKLKEKMQDKKHKVFIDNKDYEVSISDIIDFIQLDKEDLKKIYLKPDCSFRGIPLEYFLYTVYDFVYQYNILMTRNVSEKVIDNITDIRESRFVDIEALNKYLITEDKLQSQIQVNPALEKAILGELPDSLNSLEKAIYIYIKMCKIFTYDDEFYAMNQSGSSKEKHKNIEYVSQLSLENRMVTCYEFNIIFAYMLEKLGLNFKSFYLSHSEGEEDYGQVHVFLMFRSGKFLVKADSVSSILKSDLTLAKLNKSLSGLEIINKNENTRNEFERAVCRVQRIILKQEMHIGEEEFVSTFISLMQRYSVLTNNIKKVSLEERVDVLREKIKNANLTGMDTFTYINSLQYSLFGADELLSKIHISIFRNNLPGDGREASAVGVIVINNVRLDEVSLNQYYFIDALENTIEPISQEELQSKFHEGVFEYVDNKNSVIPGISGGKSK